MDFDDESLLTRRLVGDNTQQGRFLIDGGSPPRSVSPQTGMLKNHKSVNKVVK